MITLYGIYQNPGWVTLVFVALLIWTMIWKGIALWFAGKHQQKGWFIVMFILNTVGILPIIYLIWFRPKKQVVKEEAPKKEEKKKAKRKITSK